MGSNYSDLPNGEVRFMSKISVALPEQLEQFARWRVRTGGYGTVSEYIRELIRIDQRFELARVERERDEAPRHPAGGSRRF